MKKHLLILPLFYALALLFISSKAQPEILIETSRMCVADFTGDGKDDFLAMMRPIGGYLLENSVDLYVAGEDGRFTSTPMTAQYGLTNDLVFWRCDYDFNGDGLADIFVPASDFNSTAYLLISNGDATFTKHVLSDDFNLNDHQNDLYIGDFNGDGRPDILRRPESLSQDDTKSMSILFAVDDESKFFEVVQVSPEDLRFDLTNGYDICLGDFNGDGRTDLLTSYPNQNQPRLHLSNGDGTFEKLDLAPNLFDIRYCPSIRDFDLDGKDDILAFDLDGKDDYGLPSPSRQFLFLSNGDGTFQPIEFPSNRSALGSLFGDFDGDSKCDVFDYLAQDFDSPLVISIYFFNGTAFNHVTASHSQGKAFGVNILLFYMGDFNADNRTDFLTSYYPRYPNRSDMMLYLSNGDGTFTEQSIDSPLNMPI